MKPEVVKLEDTDGDFPKSSISATPAEFVHTVTEVVINHDGDGDDSGFQSHCVEKTFDPRTPVNSHLRRESDDGTPSSIGSSEKSVVSSGAQRVVSDITSHSRPAAFTPSRIKRRSLFTLRRSNSSPPPPPPTIADRSQQKPSSMRMSTSISQEYSSNSCRRAKDKNHLVAHTVAERRARAEALEVERRRARRAILEASEAALEAARQRAHSLRAARSLELRNREEERHARVVARRKLLEEERKEYLIRRITSTATITETGDQSRLRSLRHPKPKISICGFASELDPSDPRYCPFGFGSCTRRDVCPSPMHQLAAIRKTESCSDSLQTQHAPKQLQPISPRMSKDRSRIPPTPTPRSKALTLQLPKAAPISGTSSVPQTIKKQRCGVAVKSSTCTRAGCEPAEVAAQVYRARLNEHRQVARERRATEEEEEAARL
ncbi:hypothetical protein TSMEX_010416 [Taenia solium]|eukprot:TsM_001157000 transcript=TsM_001157000 gene=TsM_001157000